MGKKMVAIMGMRGMPGCTSCRFLVANADVSYCLAQSFPKPYGGWHVHRIIWGKGTGGERATRWREPTCPLAIVEAAGEALWHQENGRVVLCTGCDSCFDNALIHGIADYDVAYPMYCPNCGARMANWQTGEDPDDESEEQ